MIHPQAAANPSVTDASSIEQEILKLESNGKSDEEIAASLTERGFHSPMHRTMLPSTVKTIRLSHRRFHRYKGPRPRHIEGIMTVPQIAQTIGVTAHWIYNLIRRGVIRSTAIPPPASTTFPTDPRPAVSYKISRTALSTDWALEGGIKMHDELFKVTSTTHLRPAWMYRLRLDDGVVRSVPRPEAVAVFREVRVEYRLQDLQ